MSTYTSLEKLQNALREALARNLEEGLELFIGVVAEKAGLYNDLTLQIGSYRAVSQDYRRDTLSFEKFDIKRNKILEAALAYVNDLRDQDTKPGVIAPPQEMDWEKLERLGLASEARLLVEKIRRLREELLYEDNPTRKMRYERDIAESEARLSVIRSQA